MRDYFVKLEYRVRAPNEQRAVDGLTAAIRFVQEKIVMLKGAEREAREENAVVKSADLQRTDVRRPGEAGEW
jgi:hypothetical protein